jgi:hypothetical protein
VALGEVRTLLRQNAAPLGLTGPDGADASRLRSTRAAADLTARLLRTAEPAAFVRELAVAAYDVTDEEIAAALRHAPEVAAALRGTEWSLLETVRDLAVGGDGVGERAARLRDEVHRAARDHERAVSLVPVLNQLPDTVMALMREATRLAQTTRPAQPPAAPRPAAGDVSLTEHGNPPVPSAPVPARASGPEDRPRDQDSAHADAEATTSRRTGRARAVHLVEPTHLEASLATTVAEIDAEIRAYLTAHPGTSVEVFWQPVTDAAGPATEPVQGNDR